MAPAEPLHQDGPAPRHDDLAPVVGHGAVRRADELEVEGARRVHPGEAALARAEDHRVGAHRHRDGAGGAGLVPPRLRHAKNTKGAPLACSHFTLDQGKA